MRKQVALIIETSSSYGRSLLEGVVRYMRMHDDWSVFLEQRDLTTRIPHWLGDWKGDGIISRSTTVELLEAVDKNHISLVELSDRVRTRGGAHVRSDDAAIGRLAAEHLMERGFRRFAFCGFIQEDWSERRGIAFEQTVAQNGFTCEKYTSPWYGPDALAWNDEQAKLMQWLMKIEQPVGVMACNDLRGQHVLDACSKASLSVPEEVAVIGVDNDELLCRISSPPLSSVMPNAEAIGFRAAEILSALMNGQLDTKRGEVIGPINVITRQSTDVIAVEDKVIALALQYIRENACRGISVDDVARYARISRSTLERQIRRYLNKTPQQQIRSVQIKRVCELLMSTDLSIDRIANLCGFEHPEYMHVVFRREVSTTPGDFRRQKSLLRG